MLSMFTSSPMCCPFVCCLPLSVDPLCAAAQNTSVATMLACIESICQPLSPEFIASGKHAHHFYTRSRRLYERDAVTGAITLLKPCPSSLAQHLGSASTPGCIDFLSMLLQPNPANRPTAAEALEHPWLSAASL
jgi:serine/threonine protein kinase